MPEDKENETGEESVEIKAVTKKEVDGNHPASHYLVVEDPQKPTTWHLRFKNVAGEIDPRLLGAAWAALHEGYRGNVYEGPGKQEAIAKLKKLYAQVGKKPPGGKSGYWEVKPTKGADNEIEILLPFGGPAELGSVDRDGEYFTAETDFGMPQAPGLPKVDDLPRHVLYYHGLKDDVPESVGVAVDKRMAPEGIWYRVILSRTSSRYKQIVDALKEGALRASSQAYISGIRKKVDAIGRRITHWPLVELTLIDTRQPGEAPANPLAAVQYAYAKSALARVGFEYNEPGGGEADANAAEPARQKSKGNFSIGGKPMSDQDIAALIRQEVATLETERREAAVKAEKEAEARQAEIQAAVDAALKAREDEDAKTKQEAEAKAKAEGRRLPGGNEAPYQTKFGELRKYDNIGAGDLSMALGVLEAAKNPASLHAYKALAVKLIEPDSSERGLADEMTPFLKAVGMPFKANEINYSTYASYGDEWVGITYSTQLWNSIRVGTPILEMMSRYTIEIPQGSESVIIPLESTDPVWYVSGQATGHNATTGRPDATITDSQLGTAQKSVTVNKLAARTQFSIELTEDSLIPWAAQLRRQMELSGADYLESAIIDGDTTRTNGINDVAGTAATTDWHIAFDGFRHSPLVTTTTNARDGGTIADSDFIETLKLMGVQGKNASRETTAFIMSPPTYWKVMQLVELKTQDVFSRATLENGELTRIWNYPVFLSYNYNRSSLVNTGYEYLEEATGKIDIDTAADNTKGSFLAVRWDQWLLAYKRRFTIKTQEYIDSDASQIVATMRVGLAQRDTEASAISYNLTV